jgi:hypothetical protein
LFVNADGKRLGIPCGMNMLLYMELLVVVYKRGCAGGCGAEGAAICCCVLEGIAAGDVMIEADSMEGAVVSVKEESLCFSLPQMVLEEDIFVAGNKNRL